MAEGLYHILYLSSAHRPLPAGDLDRLLKAARHNNERDGVTGLLLYLDGNFIQHIEGERPAVEACFARISANPQHRNLLILSSGPLGGRQFANWSMGFRRPSRCEPADQNLFDLTRKSLDEHMSQCREELVNVFMQRFYDCNLGVAVE